MTTQFIRTTHVNGRFQPFCSEAITFWQQHGSVIGDILRSETPLTFPQLLLACREYAIEHITEGPQPELLSSYVAWVLVHLIHFGMVETLSVPPAPPTQRLNWTAVYPQLADIPYPQNALY
jgi:hypothetical protein